MEFTEEFVAEHKLTPEQVTAVKTFGTDHVANERKAWDDKLKTDGNQYAEGILNGVVAPIEKETGIKRGDGEKTADFLKRATGSHLATKQAEVDTLKAEYAEKIKNGGTDAAMKEELTKAKAEVDRLKQIEAEYEPIKGVKEQYETLQKEHGTLKLETAFGKARPSFPETVNAYEADAKWNTFKNGILTKYNIEIVDGDPIAIDKENEHKRYKLSELAAQDKDLAELTKGRQQPGSGTTIKDVVDIEGVPFKVPANATSEERSKAIRDYLTNDKKLDPLSAQFSEEFAGYLKKILGVAK
jgi:hypothetical protein